MTQEGGLFAEEAVLSLADTEIATLDVLDHSDVEWERVHRTAFLIHQHFRYEYPGPIEDLNHRLVIVPPERHLDQRRLLHRLDVSVPSARKEAHVDPFGNTVVEIHVPRVEDAIDFEAWIVVERRAGAEQPAVAGPADHPWLLLPSSRTEPDSALQEAARELQREGATGLELAREINHWVYEHIRYAHDATDIHTTAADALRGGRGVCQDFAHVMLALCRLCGLPSRYVSGHLLGEGGTHAWVEILLQEGEGSEWTAWPFDPTHDRDPGLSYVTVATGRDYADVAPTSGTYRAGYSGRLSTRKQVGPLAVNYSS